MNPILLWLVDTVGRIVVLMVIGWLALRANAWVGYFRARRYARGLAQYTPRTFTCPRCGGSQFGSAHADDPSVAAIFCQSRRVVDGKTCDYSAPYLKHFPLLPPHLETAYVAYATPPEGVVQCDMLSGRPENEREALDLERDCRYLRSQRLEDTTTGEGNASPKEEEAARASLHRSLKATSITELLALDLATHRSCNACSLAPIVPGDVLCQACVEKRSAWSSAVQGLAKPDQDNA